MGGRGRPGWLGLRGRQLRWALPRAGPGLAGSTEAAQGTPVWRVGPERCGKCRNAQGRGPALRRRPSGPNGLAGPGRGPAASRRAARR